MLVITLSCQTELSLNKINIKKWHEYSLKILTANKLPHVFAINSLSPYITD